MLRQTSVSFGDAKSRVAESTGSTGDSSQLVKAGISLQAAFRHWNNAANWKWLRTVKSDYSTVVGTSIYNAPPLIKAVYSIRVAGSIPRALTYIDRRTLNKVFSDQTFQTYPNYYDLFTTESGSGAIKLYPIPSTVESFELDYYRRMVVPCTVTAIVSVTPTLVTTLGGSFIATANNFKGSTIGSLVTSSGDAITPPTTVVAVTDYRTLELDTAFGSITGTQTFTVGGENILLDCPEEYVEGIIAWATHHYLINKAGAPRLEYWASIASSEMARALKENDRDTPDSEMCFLPPETYPPTLGPNDIRWADFY